MMAYGFGSVDDVRFACLLRDAINKCTVYVGEVVLLSPGDEVLALTVFNNEHVQSPKPTLRVSTTIFAVHLQYTSPVLHLAPLITVVDEIASYFNN
jgi:hypothetical protein